MPRRGTKRERHLAHFRETGQMTSWLEKRLMWDKKMAKELLDEMLGRQHHDWVAYMNQAMKKYYQKAVAERFEKQSQFYKLFVGDTK